MPKSIDEIEVLGESVKGEVKEIGEPEEIETKFGKSYRVPVIVKVGDTEIETSVFVRDNSVKRGVFNPRSNVYKLLTRYGCKKLKELIGKQVELRVDSRGFYRIVV